jgi:hypothetical protein
MLAFQAAVVAVVVLTAGLPRPCAAAVQSDFDDLVRGVRESAPAQGRAGARWRVVARWPVPLALPPAVRQLRAVVAWSHCCVLAPLVFYRGGRCMQPPSHRVPGGLHWFGFPSPQPLNHPPPLLSPLRAFQWSDTFSHVFADVQTLGKLIWSDMCDGCSLSTPSVQHNTRCGPPVHACPRPVLMCFLCPSS